jgi:AcrR family transcriptional regulator
MSRPSAVYVTSLRDPRGRRTLTQRRVFGAATALLDESPRAGTEVTVPELAARARITPSTLCAHFPSIDAVFAELYLDRMRQLPLTVDPAIPAQRRVSEQLRVVTMILADEPRLAVACTRALLGEDDAVADVRSQIGEELHRRVTAALGTGAWPEVVATLETVFWGALLQVQTQSLSYRTMATRLDTMASLILADH